jgi:outer membrane protein assembly factor BamB
MRERAVLGALLVVIFAGGLVWGQDWPMGGHDPARSSAVSETVPPPLVEVWSISLPGTPEKIVATGDTAVVTVRGRYAWVMAVEMETGEERWQFQVPGIRGNFRSSPAVWNGLVLVGGQLSDFLYALDVRTGEVRWERPGLQNLYTDPCVIGDLVIVGSPAGLLALAAPTGEVVWRGEPQAAGSPAASAELVFTKVWGGMLAAISLPSGQEAWRAERAWSGSPSDPVLVGDYLALVMGDKVELWDQEAGWFRGSITLPHRQPSGTPWRPAAADGNLYVPLSGEEGGWLVAVDTARQRVIWTQVLQSPVYSPCVTGEVVYVSSGNLLLAFDRGNGELLWQREFPRQASSAPIVAGGAVLCGFGHTLYKLVPAGQ